jgi:tol-pal system-associated acyl-CoA thioesterase
MQNSARTFSFKMRVIYADCTVGNHVYYGKYLEFLERARGEFSREIGFSLSDLQAQDVIFPVIECRLKYLKPARYDDILEIELWVSSLGAVRVRFEYELRRGTDRLLQAWTEHVCTSTQEKPRRIPEPIGRALRQYQKSQEAGEGR